MLNQLIILIILATITLSIIRVTTNEKRNLLKQLEATAQRLYKAQEKLKKLKQVTTEKSEDKTIKELKALNYDDATIKIILNKMKEQEKC